MMMMQPSLTTMKTVTVCEQALHHMHQSNPTAPSPPSPPRDDYQVLAFFFAVDGKFPGDGTLELPNVPRWGQKKERANAPSLIHTVAVFIDRIVSQAFLV